MVAFRDNRVRVTPNAVMPEKAAGTPDEPSHEKERAERFTELFRAHYRYVWGTLRRFGVHAGDAAFGKPFKVGSALAYRGDWGVGPALHPHVRLSFSSTDKMSCEAMPTFGLSTGLRIELPEDVAKPTATPLSASTLVLLEEYDDTCGSMPEWATAGR